MLSGRRTFHQTSVPGVVGTGAEVATTADSLPPSSFPLRPLKINVVEDF